MKAHSEEAWAVIIGKRPKYAPYFRVRDGILVPKLYISRAQARADPVPCPSDSRVVRVRITEIVKKGKKK